MKAQARENPADSLLEVEGLSKTFSDHDRKLEVLKNISLKASAGEFAALIGPSGCGKSTLFNVLAGLITPDRGRVLLEGRPAGHLRGRMAYMQQKDLLLPWRSALDNVILGMEVQGTPKTQARRQARGLLPTFGLEGFEDRYPAELSGGMRQRAALMRTILCRKEILLLDEPFGALDAMTRGVMQKFLLSVWQEFRPTVLLVTHDVEEALVLADKVYVLSARPARIKEAVSVPLERPRGVTRPEMVKLKETLLGLLENE